MAGDPCRSRLAHRDRDRAGWQAFPAAFGAATRRLARAPRGRRGAAADGPGGHRGLIANLERVVPRRRRGVICRAFSIAWLRTVSEIGQRATAKPCEVVSEIV